jgi:hypothetical protein
MEAAAGLAKRLIEDKTSGVRQKGVGMGILKKIDKMGIDLDRWIRDRLGGWILKIKINRKLHFTYLKGIPPMEAAYKKEVSAYWKSFTNSFDSNWHRFYANKTGVEDAKFIPNDLYFTVILPHMNRMNLSYGLRDKNYMALLFPEFAQPKILVRRLNGVWLDQSYDFLNRERVIKEISQESEVIIKPTLVNGGGVGILFWKTEEGRKNLERKLDKVGKDLVVQELIQQHQSLKRLHPESINTVRVMSFLQHGQVHILSSVLRMGINGSRVDNSQMGGISAGILASGQLKSIAYTKEGQPFDRHPRGGRFEDCMIPNYVEILDSIRSMHARIAHFRIMSWDIAIGKDGSPILVEANYWRGSIDLHQFSNGPLFGDLTDEVLEEVFGKRLDK